MMKKQPRETQKLIALLKRLNPQQKIRATSVLALAYGNKTDLYITVEDAIDTLDKSSLMYDLSAYQEGNSIYVLTADKSAWRAYELQK